MTLIDLTRATTTWEMAGGAPVMPHERHGEHIAFDLSLSDTGVAWSTGSDHFPCPAKLAKKGNGHERFCWWRDTFRMILLPHPLTTTVVVEAPFMHRRNRSGSASLLVLHGILRAVAIDGGHDYHEVENKTLKKWATGNGNADKAAMVAAAQSWGWEGINDNEADAFLLWLYWDNVGEVAA